MGRSSRKQQGRRTRGGRPCLPPTLGSGRPALRVAAACVRFLDDFRDELAEIAWVAVGDSPLVDDHSEHSASSVFPEPPALGKTLRLLPSSGLHPMDASLSSARAMILNPRISALLLFFCLAASAQADDWFSRGHGHAPTEDKVFVCHGYTCRIVTPVRFGPADIATIAGSLAEGVPDGAAEREAISRSVQQFETIVGARTGTASDLPGMQFGKGADDQMDCIDEATNTTSLLMFLASHGLLRHHKVEEPTARGFFLDGRYPHATAVLTDTASGMKWAIDSWPRANALPPVIMPLKEWRRSRVGRLDS